MKSAHHYLKNQIILTAAMLTLFPQLTFSGTNVNPVSLEVQARRVDRVALQSQDAAASRLKVLIRKYQGTAQEGVLLMRLAQIYQEGAGIEFRISYGRTQGKLPEAPLSAKTVQAIAKGSKSSPALSAALQPHLIKYRNRLSDSISTINSLLTRFPRYPLVDEALFIRAKAKEELGEKESAKADYLSLTSNYKDSKHLLAAYMALADIAIEKNSHAEAIAYLNPVESHPESAFFSFALYKLAWSHFNLRNIPKALSYLERHVRLYLNKLDQAGPGSQLSSSDLALRENSLLDVAAFYFDGYELNLPNFTLSGALGYFKKLQPGNYLGRMNLRFAKLLRSRLREADLVSWKNELIQKEPLQPETMDVVLTLFDHLWDQNRLAEISSACQDIENLYRFNSRQNALLQSDSYLAARNALTARAEKLQTAILKAGPQVANQVPMNVLRALYSTYIHIVPESDPRILLAHYNLAETLFKTADFSSATSHYRWILQHWNSKIQFTRPEIELKAIASRYETLHAQNKIPTKITPVRPDLLLWAEFKGKVPSDILEWIDWIDSYSGKSDETLANFEFEANRTLYQLGGVRSSLERLVKFSERHRDSKFAIPSQELVLDSLILTQNWSEIFRVSQRFLKKTPPQSPFGIRLTQLSADAAFKQVEGHYQAKNYDKLFQEAKSYVKTYPSNERVADALYLMANASLAQKDQKTALAEYSELIKNHPNSTLTSKALLARGQIALSNHHWEEAATDYSAYLKASLSKDSELWKELFVLHWITGRKAPSCEPIASNEAVAQECSKYSALSYLQNPLKNKGLETHQARHLALKGPSENRSLWSLVALSMASSDGAKADLREQLHLIRSLVTHWEKLDPSIRISTLGELNSLIPPTLERIRLEIKKATPMNRASAKAVSIRAEWIKEFEETVSKVMKLPWYRLQTNSLMQLALAYDDFVGSLTNAPVPQDLSAEEVATYKKNVNDLVLPFSSKRDDIAERAVRIASEAAIEEIERKALEERFPALTQKVEKEFQAAFTKKSNGQLLPLDETFTLLGLLEQALTLDSSQSKGEYKTLWLEAFHQKMWSKCTYLLQELTSEKSLPEHQLKMMRAMMLSSLGAQAEALLALQSTLDSLSPELRKNLTSLLYSHYYKAGSLENAVQYSKALSQATPKELAQEQERKKGTSL